MRATKIAAHEDRFRTTGRDSQGRKFLLSPFEIAIPGTDEQVPMVRVRPADQDERYFNTRAVDKSCIVIHFTAGYIKGDIGALTRVRSDANSRVSVPFVIARDGNIYNLFPSSGWAFHLGPGTVGGNAKNSKRSVGIELSNIGPLVKQEGKLYSTYTDPNGRHHDVYCNESETDHYLELDQPFRGDSYFAAFTEAQYASLDQVLRYLTARYNIPQNFILEADRYTATPDNAGFNGIASHVNFRKTGKWDIGPAFDWDRLPGV